MWGYVELMYINNPFLFLQWHQNWLIPNSPNNDMKNQLYDVTS